MHIQQGMSNNRTKSNNTLRIRLKNFLKSTPSGDTFHINHLVMELSKLNKNYSLNSARVTSLLKDHEGLVRFVKSGIWMKI